MKLKGALDANVAIGLACGGVFELLESVYSPLYVPPTVTQEVVAQGQGLPGAAELRKALGSWITEVAPPEATLAELSLIRTPADREVLAVAIQHQVDHVLTGDLRLARHATRRGLLCLQTAEVVLFLRLHHLIPAVRPVLDRMRRAGFGIDEALYRRMLQGAGE